MALVVAFALGACSDGAEVTLSTGVADSGPVAHDLAAAQHVVLTAADLPGYSVELPADPDPAVAHAAAGFQQCAGTAAAALGEEQRTAESPGFHLGSSASVSSLATVALDELQSKAAMADLSRPDLAGCITALLRSAFERDSNVSVTSARTEVVPDGVRAPSGGDIASWRTTLQYSSGGHTQVAYSSLTFLRSGRIVASLLDFQVGAPYPAEERRRLVEAMADRMQV